MSWYCLMVKPRQERNTAARLAIDNYVYLPKIPPNEMKGEKGEQLAIPGYAFIVMKEGESDFHKVKNTPGVVRFISFSRAQGGYLAPTPIPDYVIDGLMEQENRGWDMKTEYAPSDRVRIKSGAFKHYEGVIQKMRYANGETRAILLMGAIQAEIDVRELEPAA
jgi:transcription antitermination factor NusG